MGSIIASARTNSEQRRNSHLLPHTNTKRGNSPTRGVGTATTRDEGISANHCSGQERFPNTDPSSDQTGRVMVMVMVMGEIVGDLPEREKVNRLRHAT